MFLAVSPVLLAVGDFIPELFISCFRLFVSTKKKFHFNTLIHALPHRAELITFTCELAFGYESSASFQTTSQWPYSGILNYFSFKILSISNGVCFKTKGNSNFKSMPPIICVSFSLWMFSKLLHLDIIFIILLWRAARCKRLQLLQSLQDQKALLCLLFFGLALPSHWAGQSALRLSPVLGDSEQLPFTQRLSVPGLMFSMRIVLAPSLRKTGVSVFWSSWWYRFQFWPHENNYLLFMSELTIMFVPRPEGDWGAKKGKVIFWSEMGSLSFKCIFKNTIPSEYQQPFTELTAVTPGQTGQESLLGSVVRNVLPGMTHVVYFCRELL